MEEQIGLKVLLATLEILGIALAGVFGAIGVVVEYRDSRTGKVTRWGRRALIGVSATSMVAMCSSAVEMYLQQREAESTGRQALEIISEIQRNLYVFDTLGFTASVVVPLTDPRLAAYRDSLTRETRDVFV